MDYIVDINTVFGPQPLASTDLAVDSLTELMQRHGVTVACTLSTLGILLDSTTGNMATRAACSERSDLLPVATINPMNYFGDTVSNLKQDGFRIVRFFPAAQRWPLDFAPFQAVLSDLTAGELPIMVNVDRPGDLTSLSRTLGDYPAPVIFAGIDLSLLAEAVATFRQFEQWNAETSRLLSTGAIGRLADSVGADRVLFGTGAPSQPVASALHTVNFATLSDEAREAVMGGNARRLLGITG